MFTFLVTASCTKTHQYDKIILHLDFLIYLQVNLNDFRSTYRKTILLQ